MPNGGMKPSCFVCKWAKKDMSKSVTKNPFLEPIECQKHDCWVWSPTVHVCANLGDTYGGSGLSTFAENAELKTGAIYAWIEFSYQSKEHPNIPQYHHELIKLASFQEFAAWTLEQKKNAYHRQSAQKEQELLAQSKSDET